MRIFKLMMIVALLSACGRSEPSEVTLEVGKAAHVNGCNVFLHDVMSSDPIVAYVAYKCDVPESFTKEKNWWGEGVETPSTNMLAGDCLRFGKKFYCIEEMKPGESATLEAKYEIHHRTGDKLRPIR